MIKPFEIDYGEQSFMDGNYIDPKICDDIVNYCKANQHLSYNIDWSVKGHKQKKCIEYSVKALDFHHPFKNYREALQLCLQNYLKRWPKTNVAREFNILESFNIQFYLPDDGFYPWHSENMGKDDKERLRHLVFMTYLYDVDDGGTEFFYQKVTTPSKKGLTLIWPAHFTHMHRGQITKKPKAIITGWYSFVDNLELFGFPKPYNKKNNRSEEDGGKG